VATGQGQVIIDFGAHPGSNEAMVVATGAWLAAISATSKASPFIEADSETLTSYPTDGHTALDHRYLGNYASFTCGTPTAGTSVPVYGTSTDKLTGKYLLNIVWAD
jgi:hypothetical protein